MIYFSQVKGKKVVTEEDKYLGVLRDFIFRAADVPLVTKFIIKTPKNERIIIPIEFLKKIQGTIVVEKQYKKTELSENELFLAKNLLDKQIIDVSGNKVVRVNDVAIQDKDGTSYYISGVDIGLRGILRWLNLENAAVPIYKILNIYSHPHFLSWADIQPLELAQGKVQLKKEQERLEKIHSEDLADYLEKTNIKNIDKIVNTLDQEFAADVIGDLNINYQQALFRRFSPERAATFIEYIDQDDAVDILLTLPKEKRDEILAFISKEKREELQALLKLSKTPIGELIYPELLTVSSDINIGAAIEKVKESLNDASFSSYIYVVNTENQLIGVFKIHELIVQDVDKLVKEIMEQNVIVIHLTTPKEIAIKKMLKYKIYALPVIDVSKHIIGIVTFDDLSKDLLEHI